MLQYGLKIILSSIILVIVAEVAKRSPFWAAALASIPLTSLLAFIWLYIDTGNVQQVSALSQGIFWLVLPSMILFIVLPILLRFGLDFWLSITISCLATAIGYLGMMKLIAMLNIDI
jgi:hypothetical protein